MRTLFLLLSITFCLSILSAAESAEFDESHDNMFVFLEKPESLQRYGYSGFCRNTDTFACSTRLPYREYLGKKGHFASMDVVAIASGYEFRAVVLETGENYYFVAKPHDGNVLGIANGDIGFVKDITAAIKEEGKPIVDGSPVSILKVEVNFGRTSFYVNDGEPFAQDKLEIVRTLLSSFQSRKYDEELIALLQVSRIDWDRIEGRYILSIAPFYVDGDIGPVSASVVKAGSSTTLLERVQYVADDWLFVNRYVVVAGDLRYESPQRDFKRDNSGRRVWEWITLDVNNEQRQVLNSVANEPDSIVRFYGTDYYADREVGEVQRDALSKMLRLHDLLVEVSD